MAALSFYVRDLKNGFMQVICKCSHGTETPTKYLGYNLPSTKVQGSYKHWDSTKYRARNCNDDSAVNEKIASWTALFNAYLKDCEHTGNPFSARLFINSLDSSSPVRLSHSGPPTLSKLAEMYEEYITRRKDSSSNIKAYRVVKNQICGYENIFGPVLLHQVGEDFYNAFGNYIIKQENNTNNSVKRKITRIVTIMNYAFKKKLVKEKLYEEKPIFKGTPSKKISLLPNELAVLEKYKATTPAMQAVKDAFLVACYTGLRFSDITQLKPAHIHALQVGKTNIDVIDFTQVKGTKANTIPLSARAKQLLIKYTPDKPGGLYFPFTHSQQISRSLKSIFEDAKLNRVCEVVTAKGTRVSKELIPLHQLISFHMGRNTYITNLLAEGMPAVYVKDNVAHADIRTTMGYSKQDDYNRFKQTLAIQNRKK